MEQIPCYPPHPIPSHPVRYCGPAFIQQHFTANSMSSSSIPCMFLTGIQDNGSLLSDVFRQSRISLNTLTHFLRKSLTSELKILFSFKVKTPLPLHAHIYQLNCKMLGIYEHWQQWIFAERLNESRVRAVVFKFH